MKLVTNELNLKYKKSNFNHWCLSSGRGIIELNLIEFHNRKTDFSKSKTEPKSFNHQKKETKEKFHLKIIDYCLNKLRYIINCILSVIASQSYTTKLNVSAQFKHQITCKNGEEIEKYTHTKRKLEKKILAKKLRQKVLRSSR